MKGRIDLVRGLGRDPVVERTHGEARLAGGRDEGRERVIVLGELAELALGFGDASQFFDGVAARIVETTGADFALVLTSRTTLTSPYTVLATSDGLAASEAMQPQRDVDALLQRLSEAQRPLLIPTLDEPDEQLAALMEEWGLGSAIVAPVATSRQARLVVAVLSSRSDAFTTRDPEFVMSVARLTLLRRRLGRSEAQVQAQAVLRASVQELEDRDERNERAQRISHVGYWDRDYPRGELLWSDETYRIFGREPRAVAEPGAIFYESLHPDDREGVLAALQAAVDDDEPYRTRHRIVLPSGAVRVVDEVAEVVRDEQGAVARMLGTIHDVTEQVGAERRILESNEQINAILEAAPDAIIVADDQDRILRANAASEGVLGWDPEDLIGRSITELVGGKEQAGHEAYIQHYKETGEPSTAEGLVIGRFREATGRRADGSDFPAELAVAETSLTDGSRLFVAAIRDVSARKGTEAQLRGLHSEMAARAEERQALVQQLLTAQEEERRTVSYEIHDGPVQEIAAARMFLEAFTATSNASEGPGADYLERAIEQLDSGLRETRRIMAGLRPALLDDLGLGEALSQLLREQVGGSGVLLEVDTAGLVAALSPAVEITLFRVAQEATGNALRHSGTDRIEVRLFSDESTVCLDVEDHGSGFDPSAVSGPSVGEHFGLVGMRERSELLGGTFELKSRLGEGTMVRATIPL